MIGESVVTKKRLLQLMKRIAQTSDYHQTTAEDRDKICEELKLDPAEHRWALQYSEDGTSNWPVVIALEAETTVLAPGG